MSSSVAKDGKEGGLAALVASAPTSTGLRKLLTLADFYEGIRTDSGDLPLDHDQQDALQHDFQSPLWILAGPGTGKTHTLVWLVLKRILVDGIDPRRIFLTTFTRRAAAELDTRLMVNRQVLIDAGVVAAADIDIPQMFIGTLHSLCMQILHDQRYDPTLRIRVLEDERAQAFFVRRCNNPLVWCQDIGFWARFGMVRPGAQFPPNTAKRTAGACMLFNRMTENSVDLEAMEESGDPGFERLVDGYRKYMQELEARHHTDQASLQRRLLEFLGTAEGSEWLGDGFTVLVDEFQDTNPIQEAIYFKLAGPKGDITVVGDDDQSLYRFRGATVESLIDFDRTCADYLGCTPTPVYLRENRRSHPEIVDWVNRFIGTHPDMQDERRHDGGPIVRVRAPGKPSLVPQSAVDGPYPAVMAIVEANAATAAAKMVDTIQELRQRKLVDDYSQIALLTFSTRETSQGIGTYIAALNQSGIPVYNPRRGTAQKDPLFLSMVGALCHILQPNLAPAGDSPRWTCHLPRGVPEYIRDAWIEFDALESAGNFPQLVAYVRVCQAAIRDAQFIDGDKYNYLVRKGGRRVTLSGLLYKLLAYEPFAGGLLNQATGERLKALNVALSDYEAVYDSGELRLERAGDGSVALHHTTLSNIYSVFIEGIHAGVNDPEDEEIIIQPEAVNVMTIHQAKGLEFDVVFVLRPDKRPFESETHVIEDELADFVRRPVKPIRRSRKSRAAEDAVRLFFVAYSRAKSLLVLTGTGVKDWALVLPRGKGGQPIDSKKGLLEAGVYLL